MSDISWKNKDIVNVIETNPVEIIRTKIEIRLRTFKGEWLRDFDFGIPQDFMQVYSTQPELLTQIFADEILKVEGTTEAKSTFQDIDPVLRTMSLVFLVNTIYNESVQIEV